MALVTDTCNARYPTGLDRCSLDVHSNKTKHKDETSGREWGGKKARGNAVVRGAPKRTKGLPRTSEKQSDNLETWAYIKRCFLACHPFCVDCGRAADDEWLLDLDHVETRAWEPENAALRCRNRFDSTKGCHASKHGVPMFSGKETG